MTVGRIMSVLSETKSVVEPGSRNSRLPRVQSDGPAPDCHASRCARGWNSVEHGNSIRQEDSPTDPAFDCVSAKSGLLSFSADSPRIDCDNSGQHLVVWPTREKTRLFRRLPNSPPSPRVFRPESRTGAVCVRVLHDNSRRLQAARAIRATGSHRFGSCFRTAFSSPRRAIGFGAESDSSRVRSRGQSRQGRPIGIHIRSNQLNGGCR